MNNELPLVSIIIPVYKVEKYLSECLDSVVNQTYKNLEIILVDDGSPDNCGKICDEYAVLDRRIRVIHKENGGLCSARNAGIDIANGEWIYSMDSDDYIENDLIEIALNTAVSDNTDMCFFDYEIFSETYAKSCHILISDDTTFKNLNELKTFITYFSGGGYTWSFIVKSNVVKGKIKFDEQIKYVEDELFKFQLYSKISSFSYVHKTLYHYRVVSSSITNTMSKNNDYSDMMKNVYHKMIKEIEIGNYPVNAVIVPNTRLISRLNKVIGFSFQNRFSLKCDYSMIKKFIDTDEYKQARINYDKKTAQGRSNVLYASLKNPNRFTVTLMYLLLKVREFF